ncbi:hypothetical protein [Mycoavidus sp. B2-EB]|uniref:hypothetical protein n=1 Tax=Mycoavidus sp. B2-EB TaxID=2651972 RepID=UPI0016254A22|nr:hypothetical protein [Mycoavidus sp. B2-EB]
MPISLYWLNAFSAASAQTGPTINELMQLESQLKLQKLKNELSQTYSAPTQQPRAPHLPPFDSMRPNSTEQPRYIAVFGIAPDYRGYLIWGEHIYPLYAGAIVRDYKVTELNPQAVKLRSSNGRIRSISFAFDTRIALPAMSSASSQQLDLAPLPAAINRLPSAAELKPNFN